MMAAYCEEGKLVGGREEAIVLDLIRRKNLGTSKGRENGGMPFLFVCLFGRSIPFRWT